MTDVSGNALVSLAILTSSNIVRRLVTVFFPQPQLSPPVSTTPTTRIHKAKPTVREAVNATTIVYFLCNSMTTSPAYCPVFPSFPLRRMTATSLPKHPSVIFKPSSHRDTTCVRIMVHCDQLLGYCVQLAGELHYCCPQYAEEYLGS